MKLTGRSLLGNREAGAGRRAFHAQAAATGAPLDPAIQVATSAEVAVAAELAQSASTSILERTGPERAALLRAIAQGLDANGEALVTRASLETALPEPRLRAELARTSGQLRMFADLAEEGSWVDARIDHGDPRRQPQPRPDVRSMLRPLGPVAVFGASNFPFAFSVAGGDTASALASGNPVIAVAHPAHPGTAELVGRQVGAAVREAGWPEGTFALLQGPGEEVGVELVRHPAMRAVGFTGSRAAGLALRALAESRVFPIPVFAEMSSVNPVVLLPGAIRERGPALAAALAASVGLGVGQFCTNPGLVILPAGEDGFIELLRAQMAAAGPGTMLTAPIRERYQQGVAARAEHPEVLVLARTPGQRGPGGVGVGPALFKVSAASLLEHPELAGELFGPSTLLVEWSGSEQLLGLLGVLEGQLTGTLHGTESEILAAGDLLRALERLAGRVLVNGVPTGVEVCPAMVHGGPFPASTDGRSSSVGTRAALRFVRPVAFQDFPDALLPAELRESNPLGISRLVDGARVVGRGTE